MTRRSRRHDGSPERGAILVMAAIGAVVALLSVALAVDLGRLAQEKRNDQKVADLAALDGARDVNDAVALARASATRNHFDYSDARRPMTVKVGTLDTNHNFVEVAPPGADTVQVTVTSPTDFAFINGSHSVTVTALGKAANVSSFSLGSSLADIDTTRSTLLNQTLGKLLGSSGSLNVLSYQGLANAAITLGALQSKLGLAALSPYDFLHTNLTVAQVLTASANVLGPGTAQTDLNGVVAKIGVGTQVRLADFATVATGQEAAALQAEVNVLQLLVGSAELANGVAGISIPNLGIAVPLSGITNLAGGTVTVGLANVGVTHAPVMYTGPAGGPTPALSTSQLTATVNATVDLNVNVAGVGPVEVTGVVPIQVSGANASAVLSAVRCSIPKGITVSVATSAVNTSKAMTLNLGLLGAAVPVPIGQLLGSVSANGFAGNFTPSFSYPAEFSPPSSPSPTKHVGSTALNPSVAVTGGVGGVLSSTITPVIQAVAGAVDTTVVVPLLGGLGADVAAADVTALKTLLPDGTLGLGCGTPILAG